MRRRVAFDRTVRWLLLLPFVVVLYPLFNLLYWISAKALPTFTWATLTEDQIGNGGGLHAMILGTFALIGLATAIATAIGVLAGLYTAEYAPPAVARLGRAAGNVLAGVPAIVLGYWGYFFLVIRAGWGYSVLGGALTLSILMVPFIYRTTELAFSSVPGSQREAALALGARPRHYLRRVALPIALPQMLTGIILATAIGLGETAPLVYTAGWSNVPLTGLFSQTSYLTGAIWLFYSQPPTIGLYALAFQAAFVLVVLVLAINLSLQAVAEHYRRRLRGLVA
ncbi:MAG: ABC transporter permease subunit [Thermoplasmata archaeon]